MTAKVSVGGIALTTAQRDVLFAVQDYMTRDGSNGRPVALSRIFGEHTNRATAARRILLKLGTNGVLGGCGLRYNWLSRTIETVGAVESGS